LTTKSERTRQSILERAIDLASLEGLEGLTIGRLADELGMSKSGLFAHFGSKEELQIAVVDAAQHRFVSQVLQPALRAAGRGYPRLMAICHAWLQYVREGEVFPGGCFFAAASFEFDGRPGPVRDRIVRMMDEWIEALIRAIRTAQEEGHLEREVEPEQLAFELNAFFFGANFSHYLRRDARAVEYAMRAVEARLEALRPRVS
jgi:AcrR family transcriptional regulator